jgi:hypothetical protein
MVQMMVKIVSKVYICWYQNLFLMIIDIYVIKGHDK